MLRKAEKPKGVKLKKEKRDTKSWRTKDDVQLRERDRDLDVENLSDDFFNIATMIIQEYFESSNHKVATDIKYYVDVLRKLNTKYVEKRDELDQLIPKVEIGEEKLRFALELNATSEECIRRLKTSLAEAWTKIDESNDREQNIQDKMQNILSQCEELELKTDLLKTQDKEDGLTRKYRNLILRERDHMAGEARELEKRVQTLRYYAEIVEHINATHERYILKLESNIRELEGEQDQLNLKILNQQAVIDELKMVNLKSSLKLEQLTNEFMEIQPKLAQKQIDSVRMQSNVDMLQNANALLKKQAKHNEEELKHLKQDHMNYDRLVKTLRLEDKVKTNTISQLEKKYKKILQNYNITSSRLYHLNKLNMQLTDENTRLKVMNNSLEREILNAGKKYEELRILKDNISHERETLRSTIIKSNNTIGDLRQTLTMNGITIDGLRLDINKLFVKLDESSFINAKVEKERDELSQDIDTLNGRIEGYLDTISSKNEQIANMTEDIGKMNFNIINLKKQLDSAQSENLILKRSLDTCIQERDDIKNLNTKNSHQISQATAEINAHLISISGFKIEIERINNEKKELLTNLRNMEVLLSNTRKDLKIMRKNSDHLMKIISEDEQKMVKIKQDLEETRKERSLIGLQIVRRNDEIIMLKEKLQTMQSSLDNGTSQYNQRIEDIRLLKVEISNLNTERECLKRALCSTANMREETIRLQRQLNQERIKVRSLTDDMKTPVSIHRWRLLKGEDPQRFELMCKLQFLQKRNIKESVRYINLKKKLHETEKTVEMLKHIANNLPNNDVKEKLVKYQRKNRKQERLLKLLSAESRIHQIEEEQRNCTGDGLSVSKRQLPENPQNTEQNQHHDKTGKQHNKIC